MTSEITGQHLSDDLIIVHYTDQGGIASLETG